MEGDDGPMTLGDLVQVIWDKFATKYNVSSSWTAVFPISFLVVHALPDGGALDVLKLVNAGVLFDRSFDLLPVARSFAPRVANRIVWQTSGQVIALLKETSEEALLSWMTASFHYHYWPRILQLRLEWQPGGRGVWLHLVVYNPHDDAYTLDACKAMVVGVDGGHVEWSPLRHRYFPLEIRDAIVTLLLIHRFRRDSVLTALSKDELLHLASFVPRQWPSPCIAHIRRTGVACSGGFVRAVPTEPPAFDDCGHAVLLCRAHFYQMQDKSVALTGGPSWHRCLPECTPWWVLHWSGAARYRSATFWQRRFCRGMLVEDGVVVDGNHEERQVAILQRSSGAQEERAHASLAPRVVREEDAGRCCAVYQYLGEPGEAELFRIVYVRDNEVGVVQERTPRRLQAYHRQDLCLCLPVEETLRLVVHPTPGRKRGRK